MVVGGVIARSLLSKFNVALNGFCKAWFAKQLHVNDLTMTGLGFLSYIYLDHSANDPDESLI
eukprot:4721103-Amphidinium_carterae.1